VLDRFFSGIPHPHLLGDLAPDTFFIFKEENPRMNDGKTVQLDAGEPPHEASPLSNDAVVWTEQFKIHSFEVDLNKRGTLESLCRHFQEAAWNHAEHLGVGYERLTQENRVWVLARLLVKFERHPLWAETITVRTWPRQSQSVFALRDFQMFDSAGACLISGTSFWLVLDATSRRPQRVDKLISAIKGLSNKRALDQEPQKLDAIALQTATTQFTVRYSDIDVNGHVNNARYIGWLMDSYTVDFHRMHAIRGLEVNYLGETVGEETVSVFSQEVAPGQYRHSIKKTKDGVETCRAKLLWSATSPALSAGAALVKS
jgi:medium-chain acyl-[acyl-carrier-protein] hydrolase